MSERILVIGGGVVGCLTAMVLRERGYSVALADRGEIGSHRAGEASWAAAGILFPLLPWMYPDAVNRMALAGAEAYPALTGRLREATGIDPEYQANGMLILPEFDQGQAAAWFSRHPVKMTPLSPAQMAVRSPDAGDALWLPTVGQVRPPRLLKALRAWLVAQGVTLHEHADLQPLAADAGHLTQWPTANGGLQADRFVLAAGAWSQALLPGAVPAPQIKPMRGQILLYPQPAKRLEHMVYRKGFYLVPRRDGFLLAGSNVEDVGFDAGTTMQVREELATKVRELLPQVAAAPVQHWSGLRPGSPDNLPTVAQHPAIGNLYLNTGHFRYGLTMAPASAALLADLLEQRTPLLDPQPYAWPSASGAVD